MNHVSIYLFKTYLFVTYENRMARTIYDYNNSKHLGYPVIFRKCFRLTNNNANEKSE